MPMKRLYAVSLSILALATCPTPSFADNEMVQSPLMMRRAGPSCRPGNLGGDPGAGYRYRLGPCAGAEASPSANTGEGPAAYRRRRRF